jgi:hypothetical protein
MKVGKAVSNRKLRMSDEQRETIMDIIQRFAVEHNLTTIVEQKTPSAIFEPTEGAYDLIFTFIPTVTRTKKLMYRHQPTMKMLKLEEGKDPIITISLSYQDCIIEDTDNEHINQFHYFASTQGMDEREYRRRHWECYSNYNPFDYDTEADEIAKCIVNTLTTIVNDYTPLFK